MDRAKLHRSALVWSAGGGLRRAFFRWKEWHTRRVRLRFAVWHLVQGGVMARAFRRLAAAAGTKFGLNLREI